MATKSNFKKDSAKPPLGPDDNAKSSVPDDPVVQVRLISADVAAFKKFVAAIPLEFACAGPRLSANGVVTAHVLMKESVAKRAAREPSVKVEIVADLSATTGKRRAEVGRGNRFEDRRLLPTGRGILVRKPT